MTECSKQRCHNPAFTADPGAELCREHLAALQSGEPDTDAAIDPSDVTNPTDDLPATPATKATKATTKKEA